MTERALVLYSEKKTDMPAKIAVHPVHDTFYHAMPAAIEEVRADGDPAGLPVSITVLS